MQRNKNRKHRLTAYLIQFIQIDEYFLEPKNAKRRLYDI